MLCSQLSPMIHCVGCLSQHQLWASGCLACSHYSRQAVRLRRSAVTRLRLSVCHGCVMSCGEDEGHASAEKCGGAVLCLFMLQIVTSVKQSGCVISLIYCFGLHNAGPPPHSVYSSLNHCHSLFQTRNQGQGANFEWWDSETK